MSHLPTAFLDPSTAVPVVKPERSVGLGLRTWTPSAGAWRAEVVMTDEVGTRASRHGKTKDRASANIHAVYVYARVALAVEERTALAGVGIAAPSEVSVTVAVPRALWRNLPGGRGALRLRVRARAWLLDGRLTVEAEALHLFPAEGCRRL